MAYCLSEFLTFNDMVNNNKAAEAATPPSRAAMLLSELKAAVAASSGRGWVELNETNIEAVMAQFSATTVAELLAGQAEFAKVNAYFSLLNAPEGEKGAQYISIGNTFAGVPNGVKATDWSKKFTKPYASGSVRKCVKSGISFWSCEKQTGDYAPGFYYRIVPLDEAKGYLDTELTKKPS